jgi:hypothetical protein
MVNLRRRACFDHDDCARRQGELGIGEKPIAGMSETQLSQLARLDERLQALKERL